MSRRIVVIGVIVAILLFGGSWYYAFYISKKIVKVSPVYVDNTEYIPNEDYPRTIGNRTILRDYWVREYAKTHTWNASYDGFKVSIHPDYILDYQIFINVTIKSRNYVEKITQRAELPGKVAEIYVFGNYKDHTAVKNRPRRYIASTTKVDGKNALMNEQMRLYFGGYMGSYSFRFTINFETNDSIYVFTYIFNISGMSYPFLEYELPDDPDPGYHVEHLKNATFFCYTPYGKRKVVVSDHVVYGTEYFFAEKNGNLSYIYQYIPETKEIKRELNISALHYFTEDDMNATLLNGTALSGFWREEYLKTHSWNLSEGGISIRVYTDHVIGTGNDGPTDALFTGVLTSSKFVNMGYFLSDAERISGIGYPNTVLTLPDNPLNNGKNYTIGSQFYNREPDFVAMGATLYFNTSDFTFTANFSVRIQHWDHQELPLVEEKIVIRVKQESYFHRILINVTYYTLNLHLNLTSEEYPFLDPRNVTNGTYFCYVPDLNAVITSDHVLDGTKYYFVEANGLLSRIVAVQG